HRFESWFQNSAAFDTLEAAGQLACPVCGDGRISKAVMAPRIGKAEDEAAPTPAEKPLSAPPHPAEAAMRAMRAWVEKNSDDVGREFAAEARRIHAGEAEDRAIRGQARPAEAKALLEDGIPVAPLPWPSRKAN
ncbi:MAG: DUF1178 family protein, partial [Pseudomonadota bacterium]